MCITIRRDLIDTLNLHIGYNVINSPHLEAALLLDNALLEFSGNLEKLGFANPVENNDQLTQIMNHIKDTILPGLKLWQYYVIDTASEKASFVKAWTAKSDNKAFENTDVKSLPRAEMVELFARECLTPEWELLGGRYRAKVADQGKAAAFISKLLESGNTSAETAENELGRILDDLNVRRYALFNEDVTAILDNTKGRIEYTRLAEHGPKLGKITPA